MAKPPVLGLLRLDVEDYLTPESDWALQAMLETLWEHKMPASLAVVGEKARVLAAHGYGNLLREAAGRHAVGFHSTFHSRHPTLAEALAELDYAEGVRRFVEEERPGVELVARWLRPPRFFTQPGGNWVPHAVDALPQLGMEAFFGEDWNSYLWARPFPLRMEGTVLLSPPVAAPRPFVHALPDSLPAALAAVAQQCEALPTAGLFVVVTHPTELVTREFWDAVNFAHGRTQSPLRPAPLRPAGERERALQAWRRYVAEVAADPRIRWMDADGLLAALAPAEATDPVLDGSAVAEFLGRRGLTPGIVAETAVSAGELTLWLAERIEQGTTAGPLWRALRAPERWRPSPSDGERPPSVVTRRRLRELAGDLAAAARTSGRLPERVGGMALETVARWLVAAWTSASDPVEAAAVPLGFLDWVKPPERLHWDWPIFPPDFRPMRLWEETRRLAWSLRPIAWRGPA